MPQAVNRTTPGCVVHTAAEGTLEELLPFERYAAPADVGHVIDVGSICAFFWCPGSSYLQGPLAMTEYTPIVAICLLNPADAYNRLMTALRPHAISISELGPRMKPAQKELAARAVSQSLRGGFAAAIALPRRLLERTARNVKLSYQSIVNALIIPLMNAHRERRVHRFHLRIEQPAPRDSELLAIAKTAAKTVLERGMTVEFVGKPEEPWSNIWSQVAKFIGYCVGRHYNQGDNELLTLIGQNDS